MHIDYASVRPEGDELWVDVHISNPGHRLVHQGLVTVQAGGHCSSVVFEDLAAGASRTVRVPVLPRQESHLEIGLTLDQSAAWDGLWQRLSLRYEQGVAAVDGAWQHR